MESSGATTAAAAAAQSHSIGGMSAGWGWEGAPVLNANEPSRLTLGLQTGPQKLQC